MKTVVSLNSRHLMAFLVFTAKSKNSQKSCFSCFRRQKRTTIRRKIALVRGTLTNAQNLLLYSRKNRIFFSMRIALQNHLLGKGKNNVFARQKLCFWHQKAVLFDPQTLEIAIWPPLRARQDLWPSGGALTLLILTRLGPLGPSLARMARAPKGGPCTGCPLADPLKGVCGGSPFNPLPEMAQSSPNHRWFWPKLGLGDARFWLQNRAPGQRPDKLFLDRHLADEKFHG